MALIRFSKKFMTQKRFEASAVGENTHFASGKCG